MSARHEEQTNWYLGMNTAYFHLQYPLPDLTCNGLTGSPTCPKHKDLPAYSGQLPYWPMEEQGTPNQKTEWHANQIADLFFVNPTNPLSTAAQDAYGQAVSFFQDQAQTDGHQCVGSADEALTASHGPIWWRAIMSLRITSWGIANGKVSGFNDSGLENAVLGWIQCHYALSQLGEIQGGLQIGKVLLPGARWQGTSPMTFPNPCPSGQAPDAASGSAYPQDPITDQVSNVIYQLIKTDSVPWSLGEDFWELDPCSLDRVAAPLAQSVIDNSLGFGSASDCPKLLLRSQLLVTQYSNGHLAQFPCGMPGALQPSCWAWADYGTGCMGISDQAGQPPQPFSNQTGTQTPVNSVLSCNDL